LKTVHHAHAKEVAEEHNMQFNPKQFSFSSLVVGIQESQQHQPAAVVR
jgi:hypothetical protein